MNRKILIYTGIGQFVLAAVFIFAAWHWGALYRDSVALEANISKNLLDSEQHILRFARNLQSSVPNLRDAGKSLNNISGRRQWGTPMIKCAEDIETFTQDVLFSDNGKTVGNTGRFIAGNRPVSISCLSLCLICAGIALVFVINGIVLLAIGGESGAPNHRQRTPRQCDMTDFAVAENHRYSAAADC